MKTNLFILSIFFLFFACEESNSYKTNDQTQETSSPTKMISNSTIPCYIGTYTRPEGHVNGQAEGIYRLDLNTETGKFSNKRTVAKLINPSFIKLSPDKKYLYAVSELAHADEPTGFIYAYKVTPDSLEFINKLPTDGQAPCHIEIDKSGDLLCVSNYLNEITKTYIIDRRNGSLKEKQVINLNNQGGIDKASHLHALKFSPDNQVAVIADLGKDKIWRYGFNKATQELMPMKEIASLSLEEGAGPRHLVWSKDGKFIYVINELNSTISVVQSGKDNNEFKVIQTITTLPDDYDGKNSCADIHLHPNGKFLYGSNRGSNSIVNYIVNQETGLLKHRGISTTLGEFPRNFSISPNGDFLFAANQNSNNITTFKIDKKTGLLEFTGLDFKIETPVCIEY